MISERQQEANRRNAAKSIWQPVSPVCRRNHTGMPLRLRALAKRHAPRAIAPNANKVSESGSGAVVAVNAEVPAALLTLKPPRVVLYVNAGFVKETPDTGPIGLAKS
jgi:hypothetical protein